MIRTFTKTFTASLLFWFFLITLSTPGYATRDITISYQGIIESDGELLNGITGSFKFAICDEDCLTTYWSNDASSAAGSEPTESVSATLIDGIFNILLGDESMEVIPISVFEEAGENDLYLRVWFDDGVNGFEQLEPDQRLSIVPYAVRSEMNGDLLNINSVAMTGTLNVQTDDAEGTVFEIADSSQTLFSVNEDGTASPRDLVLGTLTSTSDINRVETGRIFYDGVANAFKACNNSTCAEIGLAGSSGVADITSVTASTGLSGGGSSGAVSLSVDTSVVVTKTGDHTMAGSLTASTLAGTTITGTTVNTTTLNTTGTATANALSAATTTTTLGVILPPTGTSSGNTAEARFQELAANGAHYVGFKSPDSILSNKIWVLPTADGSSGQILTTDGAGTLSWASDANAGGDITSVTAGLGLSGGATSGTATVNLGVGTGIEVGTDNILFEYDNTLASDPVLTGGQAVFDSGDSAGGLLFEGSTADGIEGLLTVTNPTSSDKTWTLPNATGTIALTDNTAIGAVTPAAGTFTALLATTSFTSSATGSLGWSLQSASNQACNTTCTNACVFGQNTATFAIVDCADTTADVCICAGAN